MFIGFGIDEMKYLLFLYFRLACPFFSEPPLPQESSSSKSTFFPDMAINHMYPRYRAITFNTRERRGDDYHIRIPGDYGSFWSGPFTFSGVIKYKRKLFYCNTKILKLLGNKVIRNLRGQGFLKISVTWNSSGHLKTQL